MLENIADLSAFLPKLVKQLVVDSQAFVAQVLGDVGRVHKLIHESHEFLLAIQGKVCMF
jgi:hypothetical protein